jgi:Tfp pilus assembly protein PilF
MATPLLFGAGITTGVTALTAVLGSTAVFAASKQQVSAKVGKPLQEAQKLAEKKQFKEAMVKVREAAAVSGKSDYEDKVVNEFMAFVAINQRDYATAAKAYEASLGSSLLTKEELPQRLTALTQLNYQLKQYDKVDRFANRYLKEVGYNNDIALLLGQAQYVRKDYAAAEKTIGELIRRSGNPKEDWLKLRMSSLHQLDRRDDVIKTLEQLLTSYPSKSYWSDMVAYLQATPGNTDRTSLEIYRLKYQAAGLETEEYMEMAELALALGQYGEALSLLQSGFDSGVLGKGAAGGRDQRLLNLAKTQAQEDKASLPTLAKEASSSAAGEISVRLGEAYLNYGQYAEAEKAISEGLAKGSVKSTAEAQLHRGIALLRQKKSQDAMAAFKAVPASSPLAQIARLWSIYASKA